MRSELSINSILHPPRIENTRTLYQTGKRLQIPEFIVYATHYTSQTTLEQETTRLKTWILANELTETYVCLELVVKREGRGLSPAFYEHDLFHALGRVKECVRARVRPGIELGFGLLIHPGSVGKDCYFKHPDIPVALAPATAQTWLREAVRLHNEFMQQAKKKSPYRNSDLEALRDEWLDNAPLGTLYSLLLTGVRKESISQFEDS